MTGTGDAAAVGAAGVPIAEVTRRVDGPGGREVVESRHLGHLVVVGPDGRQHALGRADHVAFPRSSVKPLQATACLELLDDPDLPADEVAVAWASHRGEARHLAAVRRLLGRAGVAPDELTCPPAWPDAAATWPPVGADDPPARLRHNCSGKHAMFALAGRRLGVGGQSLVDPSGPLQQHVLAHLGDVVGPSAGVGVDGCGAPAVRCELAGVARAMALVAGDERYRRVRDAGFAHPGLVAGEGRLDTALLAAGVVAKVGAEGLQAVGWVDAEGGAWGLAARAGDGARRGAEAAAIGWLATAGVVADDTWSPPPVLGGGVAVGAVRATAAVRAAAAAVA